MHADDAYNTPEYRRYKGRKLRERLTPLVVVSVVGIVLVSLAVWMLMD